MNMSARRRERAKLGLGRTKWASSTDEAIDSTSTASPPIARAMEA